MYTMSFIYLERCLYLENKLLSLSAIVRLYYNTLMDNINNKIGSSDIKVVSLMLNMDMIL